MPETPGSAAAPSVGVVAASLASGGVESLGFLNDLIARLWSHINLATGAMVKETVEPMFKEMLPGPLSSLHFQKIDLGKVPIRLDNVDVHTQTEGAIKLSVDVRWDGDCDIELRTNLLEVGVESVKLRGRVAVILAPLIDRLPIVSAVQVAFINPPELELDFTGLAQVADLSIIDKSVRQAIHQVLASMLVLPNRFLVKLDAENDYFNTHQEHLGFARITVVQGCGFQVERGFAYRDVPDVYCKVALGAHPPKKTSTIANSTSPQWNDDDTADFLLSDHDQLIVVEAFDEDPKGAHDDALGRGQITVDSILLKGGTTYVPLKNDRGEDTGASITLRCDVFRFVANDASSFASPLHRGDDAFCGLLTVLVARAWDIPGPIEEAASQVTVRVGSGTEFRTPVVAHAIGVDALNPSFDSSFRVPLRAGDMITAPATNEPTFPGGIAFTLDNGEDSLGTFVVPFETVMESPGQTLTEKRCVGGGEGGGASVEFRIMIHGVVPAN